MSKHMSKIELHSTTPRAIMYAPLRRNHFWIRDARNPVLPLGDAGSFDCTSTMNPHVIDRDGQWWLYYAGGHADGKRRVCLAVAEKSDPATWDKRGVVLDVGAPGSFDAQWTVLPHVVQFAEDRWHLYYTANCGVGEGLSSFPGIGLAISSDGLTWERFGDKPVIAPTHRDGDADAIGMAGGSVIKATLPDGSTEWRYYYTACPTLGDDVFQNQQKVASLVVSQDGVTWERRGPVLHRIAERDYENVAVATPVVRQIEDGSYRMWYSAIGTRWGYYSLCYAESDDGLHWRRGENYGDNLQLGPTGGGWERQMVQYPSVIRDPAGSMRLFYSANGYGSSGTGTALASPLHATPVQDGPCQVNIVAADAAGQWSYRIPEGLGCNAGLFKLHDHPKVNWAGPDASGALWHEWMTNDEDFAITSASPQVESLKLKITRGLHYRVTIRPEAFGLSLRFTAANLSNVTLENVYANPCLSPTVDAWRDPSLERTYIQTAAGLTALCNTNRGSGDPIRTHYQVQDTSPMPVVGEPFWGSPSSDIAAAGVILRERDDRQFTIATVWDAVTELFNNEDAHHCIHAVPTVGDLLPGQTKSVIGRIMLVPGNAEAALDAIQNTD